MQREHLTSISCKIQAATKLKDIQLLPSASLALSVTSLLTLSVTLTHTGVSTYGLIGQSLGDECPSLDSRHKGSRFFPCEQLDEKVMKSNS